jgi:hypothetical protein
LYSSLRHGVGAIANAQHHPALHDEVRRRVAPNDNFAHQKILRFT